MRLRTVARGFKPGLCLAALAATSGCASFASFAPGSRGPTLYAHDITANPNASEAQRARSARDGVMTVDVNGFLDRAVQLGFVVIDARDAAKQARVTAAAPPNAPPQPTPPAPPTEAETVRIRAAEALRQMLSPPEQDSNHGMTDSLARFEAFGELEPNTAQSQRNALVGMLVLASDRNCELYVDNLRKAQATYRSTFSLTGMLLSGVAGFSPTDVRTARVLSGLSSISTGAADTLDRSVFAEQNASVIIGAVETNRDLLRASMFSSMAKPYREWRMSHALADAYNYHGQCSISAGLSYLSYATGVNSELQASLRQVTQVQQIVDEHTRTLRTLSDDAVRRGETQRTAEAVDVDKDKPNTSPPPPPPAPPPPRPTTPAN